MKDDGKKKKVKKSKPKSKKKVLGESYPVWPQQLIGNAYFFRTVTYHLVGRVVGVFNEKFLILEDATWVAESGRFADCIKSGDINEAEPVGQAFVNLDSCTDFFPWQHSLDIGQK